MGIQRRALGPSFPPNGLRPGAAVEEAWCEDQRQLALGALFNA